MKRRVFGLSALALLVLLWLAVAAGPVTGGPAGHHTVRIEASQYQFDPGVIRVRRGDRVTVELIAADVVHGLYLDGYGLRLSADPGQPARLTFVADRPGTFRFRCSITCGAMHPFMIGKLRVGPDPLLWGGAGLVVLAAAADLALGKKAA
jgi:heme/copper-type cytochrome/quinol oxidase subunit 2